MKKNIIISAVLCTAMFGASAAELSIASVEEITTPAAYHPTFSPDGSHLLLSTQDYTGLYLYDLSNKNVTMLDDSKGSGFEPVFSKDAKTVYYRTASREDGLMMIGAKSFNLKDNKVKQVKKASRKEIDINSLAATTYVTTNYTSIKLVVNGKATEINPISDAHSYAWPTLSPDGTKILFSEPFQGVFYCNTDGSGLTKVAKKGDYPCWLSNDAILFIESHDDGYVTTSSVMKLYDIVTERTVTLHKDDVIVTEVTAAPSTGDVVYTTIDGKLYRTNIKIER